MAQVRRSDAIAVIAAIFLAAATAIAASSDVQPPLATSDSVSTRSIAMAEQPDDMDAALRRFNHQALVVLFHARREFSLRPQAVLEPGHVLLGILRADVTLIAAHLPTDPNAVQLESALLRQLASDGAPLPEHIEVPFTPLVRASLVRAAAVADELDSRDVVPGHLLLALLQDATSPAARLLGDHGVTAEAVLERLRRGW